MKNNLKFYFVTLFLLASDFVSFAQDPGVGEEGGGNANGLEGGDTPPASIDSGLTLLLLLGVLFVFYTYRKEKKAI